MAQSNHRIRCNFWLNLGKPEEEEIADKIEVLKSNRSFTSVIRDGIRLICDLRDGNLDVLFELFPWVRVEFLKYMEDVQPKPVVGKSMDLSPEVEKYLREILDKLDNPPASTGLQSVMGGSKQLNTPQFAAPEFDDDDDDLLTVQKDTSSGKNIAENFLKSLMSLQQ